LRFPGNQLPDALLHLLGSLIGEGNRENVIWGDAALDHVRDAKSDNARLARACSGKNQYRTANRLNRKTLLGI
jgi:hypothetical protein